jgi:hypothetical protein
MDIDDMTYTINGAVFEANKILGPGFLETMRKAEIKRMVLGLPEGHHG